MSDGCSFAPDPRGQRCCDEHDAAYVSHRWTRTEADLRLRRCLLAHAVAAPGRLGRWRWTVIAWLYWLAVHLAGGPRYRRHQPFLSSRVGEKHEDPIDP